MIFRTLSIILNTTIIALLFISTKLILVPFFLILILILQVLNIVMKEKKDQNSIVAYLESDVCEESLNRSSTLESDLYTKLDKVLKNITTRYKNKTLENINTQNLIDTLLNHIDIGLISFNKSGEVELFNKTARKLLSTSYPLNIRDIEILNISNKELFLNFKNSIKSIIKLSNNRSIYIQSSNIIQNEESIRIISIQNIKKALDEKEMDSWNVLIRTLNHEIMNSITPISSLASTALTLVKESDCSDLKESIEVIFKRSQNLLRFVENYRKFSQIPKPNRKLFEIIDLFKKAKVLMDPLAEKSNGKISYNLDDEELLLSADLTQIEQILINLIKNSIEAEATYITMTGNISENGEVLVSVSDNGLGFTTESINEAFVPFYTTKIEGSGLGLSFVRQIMHAHEGTVNIRDTRQSGGSVITLAFP